MGTKKRQKKNNAGFLSKDLLKRALPIFLSLLFMINISGCRKEEEEAPVNRPLPKNTVDEAISKRQSAVDECIRRAHGLNPFISGTVLVSGRIGSDGRMEEYRISRSDTGNELLERCILNETGLAVFPENSIPTQFEYSWVVRGRAVADTKTPDITVIGEESDEEESDEEESGPPVMLGDTLSEMALRDAAIIEGCYNSAAADNPDIAGNVQITWAVGPDGKVRSSVISRNTFEDSLVADCIHQHVKTWTFQPLGGSSFQQGSFSWAFSPE